jgi:hypothetical protein
LLQLVRQPEVVQAKDPQSTVAGREQLPPPEQKAVGWKMLPTQKATSQVVLLGACRQAPAPLQVPTLPQSPLGAQAPCGSATLLGTKAQVPLPLMLHAWQVPHAVEVQQTPSVQLLVLHSLPAPQIDPGGFFARQLPPMPVQ